MCFVNSTYVNNWPNLLFNKSSSTVANVFLCQVNCGADLRLTRFYFPFSEMIKASYTVVILGRQVNMEWKANGAAS